MPASKRPSSKRIEYEATQWVVKARLGVLMPEENSAHEAWLAADPCHRGAFVRAQAVHLTVQRVSALSGGQSREANPLASFFRWRAVAASIVVVAVAVAMGWLAIQSGGARYSSGVGELRQVALEDGSSMLLNTASKAVVRLSDTAREVRLAEGEALFEVAKDPNRPFLVRAGEVTVKAIGTAFTVRRGRAVEVVVTEGVVEVTRDDGAPPQRVVAEQRAVIAPARPADVEALSRREVERQLAWRTGRLEFDGQALGEAAEEINRHSRRRVVVSPQLAGRPVIGIFRSVDSEAFAQIAAEAMGAEVIEEEDVLRIVPQGAR